MCPVHTHTHTHTHTDLEFSFHGYQVSVTLLQDKTGNPTTEPARWGEGRESETPSVLHDHPLPTHPHSLGRSSPPTPQAWTEPSLGLRAPNSCAMQAPCPTRGLLSPLVRPRWMTPRALPAEEVHLLPAFGSQTQWLGVSRSPVCSQQASQQGAHTPR